MMMLILTNYVKYPKTLSDQLSLNLNFLLYLFVCRYKIWHYMGKVIASYNTKPGFDLNEVSLNNKNKKSDQKYLCKPFEKYHKKQYWYNTMFDFIWLGVTIWMVIHFETKLTLYILTIIMLLLIFKKYVLNIYKNHN